MVKKEILLFMLVFLISIPFLYSQGVYFRQVHTSLGTSDAETLKGDVWVIIELDEGSPSLFKKVKTIFTGKGEGEDVLRNNSAYNFSKNKFAKIVSHEELEKIKKNPAVESVEVHGFKRLFLDESVPVVNATDVWNISIDGIFLDGSGETVCILDSGVDFSHDDLLNKNLTGVIDCIGGSCAENGTLGDGNGHGTHVAGIVGANGTKKGVAPGVNLIGLKVCTDAGVCPDNAILAGMEWCINNSATYNISVISMSLGSDTLYESYCDSVDSSYTNLVNLAVGDNISVIVATGNDANFTAISSPACIENSTAVGMTYDGDNGGLIWGGGLCTDSSSTKDQIVCASNRNNLTDLMAPGALITSTYPGNTYAEKGGTSMATPHVSGAFAILNEFKRLEGKDTTPALIQNALLVTGKNISDDDSVKNYPRIDVKAAILFLDESPPAVNLSFPKNNLVNLSQNFSFSCNATELLQPQNLTLVIWNASSSEVVYNSTDSNIQANYTLNRNVSLINENYEWNCLSSDINGNSAFAVSNFSLVVQEIYTTLDSPADSDYTNSTELNFTCSSEVTNGVFENVTFYLWNSTGDLIYSKVVNISGTSNSTLFNYTISDEFTYSWNCLFNSNSSNTFASSNFSFSLDATAPVVLLNSPANGYSNTGTTEVVFSYNVSEANPANCSLIIGGSIDQTNSSAVSTSEANSFTKSLSAGTYTWRIRCLDLAGNSQSSSSRSITINSASSSGGSSGGGGGGGSSASALTTITEQELKQGVLKTINKGGKIKFSLNQEEHSLELTSINNKFVIVTISSNPQTLYIFPNQSRKADLNADGFYDLEVSLLSLSFSSAQIKIKEIYEKIPVKRLFNNESAKNGGDFGEEPKAIKDEDKRRVAFSGAIVAFAFVIVVSSVIIVVVSYFRKKKKKSKKRKK